MNDRSAKNLRRGWTTGACALAASRAALYGLWGQGIPKQVQIALPKGETPIFDVAHSARGDVWCETGIVKDAGDDPDVTHGVMVIARVRASDGGVVFRAGEGVGTVTKPGLPIGVGEPAINPAPRHMIGEMVTKMAAELGQTPDIEITISIPGGDRIAEKTWNPRLGIIGGLSVLGTTGIVRPFSCSAWIASIHRGVDVARATGLTHVAGCTGSTSETAVQKLYNLPDHAMLDMGDFVGGLLKYIARNPVNRLTIGGGIGKLTKLAQGAVDLHSGRSQVDIAGLATLTGMSDVAQAETALHALEIGGVELAVIVAKQARIRATELLRGTECKVDIAIVDRAGTVLARAL